VEAALAKREDELREQAREEVRRAEEERKRREEEQEEEERRRQRREKEREEIRQQEEEWQRRRAMEIAEEQTSGPPSYTSVATGSHPANLSKVLDATMDTPLAQRHLNLMRRVESLEQR
jgi:hypothetical protein